MVLTAGAFLFMFFNRINKHSHGLSTHVVCKFHIIINILLVLKSNHYEEFLKNVDLYPRITTDPSNEKPRPDGHLSHGI